MALPTFQYILDALQARHDFLAKRRQNDFASSSTLDHDSGTAYGGEEVMDRLVVDFEVGTAQEIFPALVSLDESEDVLHGTRNNTGSLSSPERVYVFPDAVWPYAKMTELYPSMAA